MEQPIIVAHFCKRCGHETNHYAKLFSYKKGVAVVDLFCCFCFEKAQKNNDKYIFASRITLCPQDWIRVFLKLSHYFN